MKWGIWSFNEGLRKSEEEKFERRKDLTDVHLRAVTEYNPPFTKLKDVDKDELPVGYKVRNTASKISSFIKFTAESRHNRSRGTDQCDNNIIVDTAYCNVVSFNKIFVFH